MCISGVGSFPVQSGGSLIYFQLFRCRKLALNRVFSYFLVVGMCLYLGRGWLHTPMFVHPLYVCMPPVCLYAPCMFVCPLGVYTSPRGPPCFCALHGFWHIACCGGVVFLFYVYRDTPPLFGGASPLITPPTLHCWFSVHCYSQGYQFLCGLSPSIEGFGGVPPITGGGWG